MTNVPYYMIATRTDGKWSPQWGDYDKSVVKFEVEHEYKRRFHGDDGRWSRKDIKIVKCASDTQQAVDQALKELNNETD